MARNYKSTFQEKNIDINEPLTAQVKEAFFPNELINDLWSISYNNEDFDYLCLKANADISNGIKFKDTILGTMFPKILNNVDHIILWYGSDWQDLDSITNNNKFLKVLEKEISEPTCESYINYSLKGIQKKKL